MRFRLQCRRLATIVVAVLMVALTVFFVKPVSANNTVTSTAVTQPTNQPNAPNLSSQATGQSTKTAANARQTQPSASTMTSSANEPANAAVKPTDSNLSSDKASGQTQQAAVQRSNNSQATNSEANGSNATMKEERESQPADPHELTPDGSQFSAKITDVNGNEISGGKLPQINEYTPINIDFDFNLTGQNIHPGDHFEFSINNPNGILNVQNTTIQLNNSNNQNIGTATLTNRDGQIVGQVTFNVSGSDVTGRFEVQLKVDASKANGEQDVPVTVTLPNNHVISANFHYVPGTDNPDERFSKYSYNSDLKPDESDPTITDPGYYPPKNITKGNLTYALRLIHHHGDAQYTDATIADQLQTPDFTYDPTSFLVYKTHWTYSNNRWSAGNLTYVKSGYTLAINPDGRSFTLVFNAPTTLGDNEGYVIFYRLLYKGVPVNKVTNTADQNYLNHLIANKQLIINNQAELTVPGKTPITYPQTMQVTGNSGSAETNSYSLTVTKVDSQDGHALAGAVFQLIDSQGNVVGTGTTDANGQVTFTNLLRGTYTLREVTAPAGYSINPGYSATVKNNVMIPGENDSSDPNLKVTVKDTPITTSITVNKVWQDDNNQDGKRSPSVTVRLLANGKETDKTFELNADNNWSATAKNLPKYDQNGQEIKYTWEEENVPDGYKAEVDNDHGVITNIHKPATTKVSVTKVWKDDNSNKRPTSVTINLLANGQVIRHTVLSAANNWHGEFDNLMMYYNQGHLIDYTVEEADVPAGYKSTVSHEGLNFTVTNTYEPTTPTTPGQPGQPTTPVTPDNPGQPTTPTEPTTPVTPGQPVQPVTPVAPGQPSVPAQPAQPVQSQPVSQEQPRLPQTGNHDSLALVAFGLALMSLTVYVVKQHD